MELLTRILRGLQKPEKDAPLPRLASDSEPSQSQSMQVDQPITSSEEDLLDRASFAEHIARTIAHRSDPSSLVVGIYGPWGDGKTSTLAMIKESLRTEPNTLSMDYNPWFYGESTEAITRSFFHSVKSKLESSGWFSKENIGGLMASYGRAVPKLGEAIQAVGEGITTEDLLDTRDKVGRILRKHGKKIVIFIDDIDRLDRRDIQTLFKLVRLSGSFDHTTYVLAFDDAIVADSLAGSYGSGDASAGRRFLEKIVQVPLHLPPASPEKLQELMFAACNRVIAENRIELSESEAAEVGFALMQAFGSALRTPRRVKLFDNAIGFAVPILKGEVHVGDQLTIEALRVFYPNVYDAVRRNPDQLLRRNSTRQDDDEPSSICEAIASAEATDAEKQALTNLMHGLFPRFGQADYGGDWDAEWANGKRIASKDYFDRYFSYGVPQKDIADREIDSLIGEALEGNEDSVSDKLISVYKSGAADLLIRKLRHREATIELAAAPTLVAAIAKTASNIPINRDLFLARFTQSQAAILICQLAKRTAGESGIELLMSAVAQTDHLPFICQLARWSELKEENGEERGFLTRDQLQPLASALLARLDAEADQAGTDILTVAGEEFASFSYTIIHLGGEATKERLRRTIASMLDSNPQYAVSLLKAFAGRSQGGDRVVRVSDFGRGAYDALGDFLDRDRLFEQLRKIYGNELDQAKWEEDWHGTVETDRRVSFQFAAIHADTEGNGEGESA